VAEIARMLGGERLSSTAQAHAQEMLDLSALDASASTPPSSLSSSLTSPGGKAKKARS